MDVLVKDPFAIPFAFWAITVTCGGLLYTVVKDLSIKFDSDNASLRKEFGMMRSEFGMMRSDLSRLAAIMEVAFLNKK